MTEFLTLVHVGKMNFDARLRDSGDGVAQRYGCVRVATGVDQHTIEAFLRFVYPIYQLAFVVTLSTSDTDPELARE